MNVKVIDRCDIRSDNAHLDQEKLLPEEQKGCRKGSRGTNDLLYIDWAVIKEVKSRNKNLAMAWINYKKANDMVPHSWIIECLDLFGVAESIKSLLVNGMEKWKVMLCSGNSEGSMSFHKAKRRLIFSEEWSGVEFLGMEFGIEKCAMLAMEKGKIVKSVGIELPDGTAIKSLQEGESYKYLGILEADKFF